MSKQTQPGEIALIILAAICGVYFATLIIRAVKGEKLSPAEIKMLQGFSERATEWVKQIEEADKKAKLIPPTAKLPPKKLK